MRVLVTGHRGYIGTVLTPMLMEAGYDVVGLDCGLYDASTFGDPPAPVAEIRRDVRDVRAEDVAGCQAVIHLAGLSNDPLGDLNPTQTREINHLASVRLAALCRAEGVERFLFASSCSTYGAAGDDPVAEEAEFHPVTPYGESKVAVERDVAPLADERFSPVFLRCATAYGMSPRLRFDLVVNNLVAWAVTTGAVHLKSDGTPWRPLIHVSDIARAYVVMLSAPREAIHNQAFNVASTEENYRIRDVAEIVRDTVPGAEIRFADGAGPDARNYRVDAGKIRRVLPAYVPRWRVPQGAEELYAAYRKHGLALEEFEGPRYKRVAHIRELQRSGQLDAELRWTSSGTARGEAS